MLHLQSFSLHCQTWTPSFAQFEWAWQHPNKSKRLASLVPKKKRRNETHLRYKLRILAEMLSTGPWHRLPLTIRWLMQRYQEPFPISKQPPAHMPITYGPLKPHASLSRTAPIQDYPNVYCDDDDSRYRQYTDIKQDEETRSLVCFLCQQHQVVRKPFAFKVAITTLPSSQNPFNSTLLVVLFL